MRYQDVVEDIDEMTRAATVERCDALTARIVTTYVDLTIRETPLSLELTPPAQQAFLAIAERAATATAQEIHTALATIDAGVLTEGDMDSDLLRALEALEARATLLNGDAASGARRAAWCLLESVDEALPASLDDFLAGPEMAAAYLDVREALADD